MTDGQTDEESSSLSNQLSSSSTEDPKSNSISSDQESFNLPGTQPVASGAGKPGPATGVVGPDNPKPMPGPAVPQPKPSAEPSLIDLEQTNVSNGQQYPDQIDQDDVQETKGNSDESDSRQVKEEQLEEMEETEREEEQTDSEDNEKTIPLISERQRARNRIFQQFTNVAAADNSPNLKLKPAKLIFTDETKEISDFDLNSLESRQQKIFCSKEKIVFRQFHWTNLLFTSPEKHMFLLDALIDELVYLLRYVRFLRSQPAMLIMSPDLTNENCLGKDVYFSPKMNGLLSIEVHNKFVQLYKFIVHFNR